MNRTLTAAVAAVAGVSAFGASAAAAGPVNQQGLVNVNVTDVAVQVPIGIAANICDVAVNVLAGPNLDDAATCTADADGTSTITPVEGSGPARQRGLVNVNLSSVAIQIPISVVANVCDVSVGVLTGLSIDDADPCEGTGLALADLALPVSTD